VHVYDVDVDVDEEMCGGMGGCMSGAVVFFGLVRYQIVSCALVLLGSEEYIPSCQAICSLPLSH
jgi:hypothetical protein